MWSEQSLRSVATNKSVESLPRRGRLQSLADIAQIMHYNPGAEICSEGDLARSWFELLAGVARRYIIQSNGRRQILDLLFPGDFFGFTLDAHYGFIVEAVCEGTVAATYPRRLVESLADSDPFVARELRQVMFEAMARSKMQLMMVGHVTAVQKVGSFLVAMASRSPEASDNRVDLPVSRYDIADYLSLSVETVSRSLTELKRRGAIALPATRTIRIVNWSAFDDSI